MSRRGFEKPSGKAVAETQAWGLEPLGAGVGAGVRGAPAASPLVPFRLISCWQPLTLDPQLEETTQGRTLSGSHRDVCVRFLLTPGVQVLVPWHLHSSVSAGPFLASLLPGPACIRIAAPVVSGQR